MKIKINSSKVIRSLPKEFNAIAKGNINHLPHSNCQVNDRLIIKEHTGTKFTGKEILASVKEVSATGILFIKQAII